MRAVLDDITVLDVDAIVNAANETLLGSADYAIYQRLLAGIAQ
jgi:O-acetyl-ADP-ribose deacetylase (regulator of RNase III)